MKEKWKKEKNTGSHPTERRYTVSRSYLLEAALDREWERNYFNGRFSDLANLSQEESLHLPEEETQVSVEEKRQP